MLDWTFRTTSTERNAEKMILALTRDGSGYPVCCNSGWRIMMTKFTWLKL